MSGLYSFTGNSASNSYDFITAAGISVNVYFYPGDFIFPKYDKFKHLTYHFGFSVSALIKSDVRVKKTISFILYSHFMTRPDSVILWVCDAKDEKEYSRHRKFNGWFLESKDEEYEKLDTVIVADTGDGPKCTYISLIFQKSNPHTNDIKVAFDNIESDFQEKDLSIQE